MPAGRCFAGESTMARACLERVHRARTRLAQEQTHRDSFRGSLSASIGTSLATSYISRSARERPGAAAPCARAGSFSWLRASS